MDADGNNTRRLSEGRLFNPTGAPSWSPDGTQVVFQGNTGVTANDLYVVNADGAGQRKLTDTPDVREFTPAWSPDGSRIAFSQLVPPCTTVVCNFEIFTIDLDGSGKTRLTHDSDQDTHPDWSPDGTKVAYGTLDGVTEVRVVSASGTDDVGFSPPALGYTPAWSPDGGQIAWSGFGQGNEINVMNADGSQQRNVSNSAAFDVQPDWQPVNRPPDCTGVSASPAELRPPNHKLVPIRLSGASDPDGDLVTFEVTAVTQDEPVAGPPDAERSTAPGGLLLRAERDGAGDGRVYRVAFVARDGFGGACSGTTTVGVRKGSAAPVDRRRRRTTRSGPERTNILAAMLATSDTAIRSLHLIGAAVWVGGMVMLALAVGAARRTVAESERMALFRALGRRFQSPAGSRWSC